MLCDAFLIFATTAGSAFALAISGSLGQVVEAHAYSIKVAVYQRLDGNVPVDVKRLVIVAVFQALVGQRLRRPKMSGCGAGRRTKGDLLSLEIFDHIDAPAGDRDDLSE